MSVLGTIGRGMAWNSSATVVGKVLMFANVFLILTFLSVYEYGFSELVLSIVALVGIVLLPGLTSTIVADMSVEKGRGNLGAMSRIFHQHLTLNFVLGLGAWAFLFFLSQPAADLAGSSYAAQFLHIASFTFLIAPMRTATQTLATVMLRFFDQSFYVVIEETFKFIFLLLFIVWQGMGLHGLMFSIILSQIAVVVLYLPRTVSAYGYFSRAEAEGKFRFWNLLREHRKWSVGSSYVGTIAQNARLWIIKFFLGTEAVGLFAFALGIFSHVTSLLPLTTVLSPVIPHYVDKRDQLVRILRASMKFQVILSTVLVIIALLLTKPFVALFFPKYLAAVPLVYIVLLAALSNSVVNLFSPVFAAFKEQQSMLYSNVFKTVLIVVILPPSIMFFGLLGVGVEVVLTTLANGIERYIRLRRFLPEFVLKWRELVHPDPAEREAMRVVLVNVKSRFSFLWPTAKP